MWVEFVVSSCPYSEGFSPGTPVFSSSSETNISKFQFDPELEGYRFVSDTHDCLVSPSLNKVDLFHFIYFTDLS